MLQEDSASPHDLDTKLANEFSDTFDNEYIDQEWYSQLGHSLYKRITDPPIIQQIELSLIILQAWSSSHMVIQGMYRWHATTSNQNSKNSFP